MNRIIRKIYKLAKRLPNQVLMEDGFILIKSNKVRVRTFNKEDATKMRMTIDVSLEKIENIQL
jgi:hypothetical protein